MIVREEPLSCIREDHLTTHTLPLTFYWKSLYRHCCKKASHTDKKWSQQHGVNGPFVSPTLNNRMNSRANKRRAQCRVHQPKLKNLFQFVPQQMTIVEAFLSASHWLLHPTNRATQARHF